MKNGVYKYKNGRFCEYICQKMYIKRCGGDLLCRKVEKPLKVGETAVKVVDGKITVIVKRTKERIGEIPLCPDTLELMFEQ